MKRYPILSSDYELLKQYGESCVYPSINKMGGFVNGEFIYERINGIASEILELCNGINSIEDIARNLSDIYLNDESEILLTVQSFIEEAELKGYIIYSNEKTRNSYENIYGNYDCIYPIFVTFEVTKKCPLKCKHCFNNSGETRVKELECQEIIDVLTKIRNMGVKKIMLTGGEPFTKEGFEKVINYASEIFHGVVVGTNGFLINEDLVNKIELSKNNVVFQVSVDGMKYNHDSVRGVDGSFDKAIDAIKLLVKKGHLVIVSNTVNEFNIDDTYELSKYVKELGAKQITISSTLPIGRAKHNFISCTNFQDRLDEVLYLVINNISDDNFYVSLGEEDSYAAKGRGNCGHGDTQVCIRENGDVSPCVHYPLSYGNLKNEEPEEVFHYSRTEGFRLYENTIDKCIKCGECIGCPAYVVQQSSKNCNWIAENKEYLDFISKYKINKSIMSG